MFFFNIQPSLCTRFNNRHIFFNVQPSLCTRCNIRLCFLFTFRQETVQMLTADNIYVYMQPRIYTRVNNRLRTFLNKPHISRIINPAVVKKSIPTVKEVFEIFESHLCHWNGYRIAQAVHIQSLAFIFFKLKPFLRRISLASP